MSSYVSSNLVAAQLKVAEEFNKAEFRQSVIPAITLGLKNQNAVPGYVEARKREDRPVYVYAQKRIVNAVGSARSANHTGPNPDSFQQTLSWSTYSSTFSVSLKMMDTNVYSMQNAMENGIRNCVLDIHRQIESARISFLLASRTQVIKSGAENPAGGKVVWNSTNYAYEVQAGNAAQFYSTAKTAMMRNYYNESLFDIIVDGGLFTNSQWYLNQGTGNYQNTQYQFAGMNPVYSTDLSDSSYTNGTALIMPANSYAILPWIPKQNRQGVGNYDDYVGGFGMMADPYGTGLEFAVHAYALRADKSSSNGNVQDVQMEFEISIDIADILQLMSTSNESVVYQFAQL